MAHNVNKGVRVMVEEISGIYRSLLRNDRQLTSFLLLAFTLHHDFQPLPKFRVQVIECPGSGHSSNNLCLNCDFHNLSSSLNV